WSAPPAATEPQVTFVSKVFSTRKTVTISGTGTSLIVNDTITPKLAPPPPLIAQKRSSPMDFLSRRFPLTSTICASMTLSTDKPYFLNMLP
ncbi:hypothetical protein CR513_59509, partial [Mucuna pruriens]